ncbi:putative membrane protein [Tamaricihabitans halophyticus]|uniref:Putative membrane protein n=1 Tax=Tamaricihabitans halophyticus TaxID=1262583 RepID=A0A4R2QQG1_9PSEU|nr:anthrone oxygenase family protein [Tamaricihabitans halophyticus]TCP51960.1 putative membrane protein [Tamaricihabitans halophyticus]
MTALELGAMLTTGVMAGVYAAFSIMIMPALRPSQPSTEPAAADHVAMAISTMRSINRTAERTPFRVLFFGTTLLALAVALHEVLLSAESPNPLRLAGAALSLSAFVITAVFHVPRNNRIDALAAEQSSAADWARLATQWTYGNHVRAIGSALGALAFGLSGYPGLG